jgi:protein involved in polysaccharide export with SLBB domain
MATLVNTLFSAGGPSVKGSMRSIQLKRGNQVVTEFDFYDLLLKGDKSKDVHLLPGDVIYIPPVGPLAAISGSVNQPAIYEIKGESTFQDLLNLAGGLTPTAMGEKVLVERIDGRMVRKVDEFRFDQAGLAKRIRDGDLVQVSAILPKFDNAVTLRGSVAAPARYPWREGMRIKDVIPDRESLITPEYWVRQNRSTQVEIDSQGRLRTQLKRTLSEVNWDYAVVERLRREDLTTVLIPFNLGRAILDGDPANNIVLQPGDVITVFSKDDIQVPIAKQNKYVRLEGEFLVPGVYQVMPGETLRQLLARVGGFSPNAYLYGAEFFRESTRAFQQKVLDDAIDRLEEEIQRNAATIAQQSVTQDEANALRVQAMAQQSLVAKLRRAKATGRIVLEMPTDGSAPKDVPEITLEDGDRLLIPYRPSVVSVVGSVFSANAFVYKPALRVEDYVALAGGPTKDADEGSIYVVRADGTVVSAQQSGWILGTISGKALMPGDAVVVPEKLDKYKLTRTMKDIAQIFYQMALGVAGLKVLKDL